MTSRLLFAGILMSGALIAHEGKPFGWHDLVTEWVWDPVILIPLLLSAILYAKGARRAAGLSRWEQRCFWFGWIVLVISLLSPLHPMGEVLFAAHMAQHELLMVVAAPLLVLGRPLVAWLWAVPMDTRRQSGRVARAISYFWVTISRPVHAFLIHLVAIWVWHVPRFYSASVTNDFIHSLQHVSFLFSALLFWWSVLHQRTAKHLGAGLLYVFATAVHTTLLGALLTFSDQPWYAVYTLTAPDWGLTPLEDQQLGGLIMWIPPGFVYLGVFLAMFAAWLNARAPKGSAFLPLSVLLVALSGCNQSPAPSTPFELIGANPARGRDLISTYGCNACHTIPGVNGANGMVGPPLNAIARRSYLAGRLENTPENMIRWIENPKAVDDQTAMPVTGITGNDTRDVASYLYTLY
jgi:cytochrome c oxidase assembly factor CtaG/cytochrome c2